jgi:anti-sigma-K factor RskA
MSRRPASPGDDEDLLAAEYAMGLLDRETRQAVELRLSRDHAFAAVVRDWEERLAGMNDQVEPVAPPIRTAAAIEERLFGSGEATRGPGLWSSLVFWRGLAFAALAALTLVSAWQFMSETNAPGSPLVAHVAGTEGRVSLVALYDGTSGELRLNRLEGNAASDRSFELWLIAGNEPPVSLGVLPGDTAVSIKVPASARPKFAGALLAVSDEPLGGSPTGQPTGPVLATGRLDRI